MIKTVFPNQCLSRFREFEWHKKFQELCESIEDKPRFGLSKTMVITKKVTEFEEIMKNYRLISIHQITDKVNNKFNIYLFYNFQ